MGRSQPGVGLWSPHFFVLHFFESGLTLNPHNKRHSFGLFIFLYLCCVVDCINIYICKTDIIYHILDIYIYIYAYIYIYMYIHI